VFISITQPNTITTQDIYSSDLLDGDFLLSISSVAGLTNGALDFTIVDGIVGAYIVNQELTDQKQTYITFNKGGQWSNLYLNNCTSCIVNLHGPTSGESIDTEFAEYGAVLALGNEGDYLLTLDQASLYFSENGGRSWTKVKDGNCLYETTGRGSILVVTYPDADYISYSLDEGNTWKDCIYFLNTTFNTTDVSPQLFVPNNDINGAFSLLLTLVQFNGSNSQYELYSINFNDERPCNSSDYEYWYPHDSSSPCLLGQQVQFLRKKKLPLIAL